jgi:hypothetical protein
MLQKVEMRTGTRDMVNTPGLPSVWTGSPRSGTREAPSAPRIGASSCKTTGLGFPLALTIAAALTGCSDTTEVDYSACKVKAYDTFKESIIKNDDALEYVRLCMFAAGYLMTPACMSAALKGGYSFSTVAASSACFEKRWWTF